MLQLPNLTNKQKISLIISIHALYAVSVFGTGIIDSHDARNHVARLASYTKALSDGHILPRWAGDLNFGYGSPVFNFFYPLPYMAGSVVSAFGFSYEQTFNILLFVAFVLAPVSLYIYLQAKAQKFAFFGSLLYGLSPYHFLNVYIRGDIGELFGYALVPLVFYCIDRSPKHHIRFSLVSGFVVSLLILSHNAVALITLPVAVLYILFFSGSFEELMKKTGIIVSGLLYSAFFWVPALVESSYTHVSLLTEKVYVSHFPRITQLVYSPWNFGSDVSSSDGLSPQIGPIHITVCISAAVILLYFFLSNLRRNMSTGHKTVLTAAMHTIACAPRYWTPLAKCPQRMIVFYLTISIVSVFVSLRYSQFLWEAIPLMNRLQFPWRLGILTSFSVSVLGAYVFGLFYKPGLYSGTLFALLLISTIYIKHPQRISFHNEYYQTYSGSTFFHGEATPVWTAGDPSSAPVQPVEIIDGSADVTGYTRKTHEHRYTIHALSAATVSDNTLYYPGWDVYVDGSPVTIEFQNPSRRGLITFTVPEGKHAVLVRFSETKKRMLYTTVSAVSMMSTVFYFWYTTVRKK